MYVLHSRRFFHHPPKCLLIRFSHRQKCVTILLLYLLFFVIRIVSGIGNRIQHLGIGRNQDILESALPNLFKNVITVIKSWIHESLNYHSLHVQERRDMARPLRQNDSKNLTFSFGTHTMNKMSLISK